MATTNTITVSVKGVMPTTNGCAVFLGDENKSFLIYVDHPVGSAIQMSLACTRKPRPLTHDLIDNILLGLEAKLDHIVINDTKGDTYFARIVLKMSNKNRRDRCPTKRLHRLSPSSQKAHSRQPISV